MKKSILILITTLLLGVSFYSCAPSDEKVAKEVATLLSTFPDTKVTIKDGVATVTGSVDDANIKGQIEELVKSVKGIKSVVNSIDVKPQIVINNDEVISSGVTAALIAGGFNSVVATVKDGEVTLTGDLNRSDLVQVMQAVNATSPKKVINQLNLK